MWAVVGPSGCGKSTLLYLLAGLRRPQAGELCVGGHPVPRPRASTGLILQDHGLLPWATVRDNAALGLRIGQFYRNKQGAPDQPRPYPPLLPLTEVDPWLERLGIAHLGAKYPAQLSGGQRQRVAIARALALRPDLLLMDEPFSSLDTAIRHDLQRLVLSLQAELGLTTVIVTHSVDEAAFLGRRILLLRQPPNQTARVLDNPAAGQHPEHGLPGRAACPPGRQRRRRSSSRRRAVKWRQLAIGLVALLILWQIAAWLVHNAILPGPGIVLTTLVDELLHGKLARHVLVSAWRVTAAIVLALALGAPAGLALGQSERLNRIFEPLVYLTYPIPKVVLLPVFLLLLGVGDVSKIALISVILFFQILVVVRDEAAGIRPELVTSVRSLGAGRLALFRYVYLPAAIPAVATALRLSVGTAIAVLFFTESFATTSGLGYYILIQSWGRVAYPEMYAGVVMLSLLGLTLYYAADWLERRLAPWKFLRE